MDNQTKQKIIWKTLARLTTTKGEPLEHVISLNVIVNNILADFPLESEQSISNIRKHIHSQIWQQKEEHENHLNNLQEFIKTFYKNGKQVEVKDLVNLLYTVLLLLDNQGIDTKKFLADRILQDYNNIIPSVEELAEQHTTDGIKATTSSLTSGYIRIDENNKIVPYTLNDKTQ